MLHAQLRMRLQLLCCGDTVLSQYKDTSGSVKKELASKFFMQLNFPKNRLRTNIFRPVKIQKFSNIFLI
jgi:hypothetical protein